MVTYVLASPWYPTALTLALVPSSLKMALSTPDCWVSKLARYVPMEKPSSGVTAAIAVRVTLLAPPKKICGTALGRGDDHAGAGRVQLRNLGVAAGVDPVGTVHVVPVHIQGVTVKLALLPLLSASTLASFPAM